MNRTLKRLTNVSPERKTVLDWLAKELLQEWGLTQKGWRFVWGNKKASFGTCRLLSKTIELSTFLLPTIDDDEAEDTIRHEIAHALDYEERGTSDHSWKWKRWAIKVGANPERCASHSNEDAYKASAYASKYRLECPNGCVTPSHRKSAKKSSCGKCGNGYYDPKLMLRQIENAPDNIPKSFGGNAPDPQ
jgi:predicted SprT family Zn-dependent metalloprotease